jgi:hypothetical protein
MIRRKLGCLRKGELARRSDHPGMIDQRVAKADPQQRVVGALADAERSTPTASFVLPLLASASEIRSQDSAPVNWPKNAWRIRSAGSAGLDAGSSGRTGKPGWP